MHLWGEIPPPSPALGAEDTAHNLSITAQGACRVGSVQLLHFPACARVHSAHPATLGPLDICMGLADLTQDRDKLSSSREASQGKAGYPGRLREHHLPTFRQLNLAKEVSVLHC